MAADARFEILGYMATLYEDSYVAVELGKISELVADTELTITMDLGTMMQNEFEEKTFLYDVCVVPADWNDAKMLFGLEMQTVTSYRQIITLLETPSLRIDDYAQHSLVAGETLHIEGISAEDETVRLQLYLYQMVEVPGTTEENGTTELQYTDACGTLFDTTSGFMVSANGIYTASGEPVVVDGVFEGLISATAETGTYYLQFVLGSKSITLTVRVNG